MMLQQTGTCEEYSWGLIQRRFRISRGPEAYRGLTEIGAVTSCSKRLDRAPYTPATAKDFMVAMSGLLSLESFLRKLISVLLGLVRNLVAAPRMLLLLVQS